MRSIESNQACPNETLHDLEGKSLGALDRCSTFLAMSDVPDRSFEEIALPFIPDVSRFAFSLTRDSDEADDLVQDTFLKAYRSWHRFEPGTNCRSWLFTICKNTFRRRFKREKMRPDVEGEAVGDDDAMPIVMSHVNAEQLGLGDLFDRLDVQPALLRLLQSGETTPLGGSETRVVDLRIVRQRHGRVTWPQLEPPKRVTGPCPVKVVGRQGETFRPGKRRAWIDDRGGEAGLPCQRDEVDRHIHTADHGQTWTPMKHVEERPLATALDLT